MIRIKILGERSVHFSVGFNVLLTRLIF